MSLSGWSNVQVPALEYQPLPLVSVQQPVHHLLAVEGHEPVPLAVPTIGDNACVLNRTKSFEEIEEILFLDAITQASNIDPVVDELTLLPVVVVPLSVGVVPLTLAQGWLLHCRRLRQDFHWHYGFTKI